MILSGHIDKARGVILPVAGRGAISHDEAKLKLRRRREGGARGKPLRRYYRRRRRRHNETVNEEYRE